MWSILNGLGVPDGLRLAKLGAFPPLELKGARRSILIETDGGCMISLEDCIAFCGLDKDEVAAISEHEHIPEIAATALADYLLKQPHGGEAIRTMITDDIHAALCAGRVKHAQELFMALRHFLDEHPEARAGVEV
jgi:hypothetical protein